VLILDTINVLVMLVAVVLVGLKRVLSEVLLIVLLFLLFTVCCWTRTVGEENTKHSEI